tara:strand:+ start:596 stop:1150 length:555 start_codon:yes stop_codon:yes gene_type:complete
MSDLTITTAGVSESKVSGGEFLSANKKLNQMKIDLIKSTPDIAEATYATGTLMFEQGKVNNAVAVKGGNCILQSVTAIDTSDTGGAIYLIITDSSQDLGTVGSAVAAADAAADNSMAIVELNNWIDVGGAKVCSKANIGLVCNSVSATEAQNKNLYYGIVNVSGGNIVIGSGEDIIFQFGVVQD